MQTMTTTRLGRTGLEVSRLCLGCMSFGEPDRGNHPWTMGEAASRPFIRKALDLGINFFDTANVYSDGTSEEIVGKALLDYARRDEVVIATKVHGRMHPGPNGAGPVEEGDLRRDRRQPEAARHRPCRPLPDAPLGLRRADRGDAGGAERRGARRQGAAHRRLVDARLAVREGAGALREARLGALPDDAELRQPALPRGRARDAAALQGRGHRRHSLEPAGARPADPRLGQRARPGPRPTASARRSTPRPPRPTARWSRRWPRSPPGSAGRAPRWRWPGCCRSPRSRRRSSARPGWSSSTTPSPRCRSSSRRRTSPSSRRRTCRTRCRPHLTCGLAPRPCPRVRSEREK